MPTVEAAARLPGELPFLEIRRDDLAAKRFDGVRLTHG
jgi:hypothetical protein